MRRYDKLVRDNIPAIIEAQGGFAHTEILRGDDLIAALERKLLEETQEYLADGSAEELADVLEVAYALAERKGIGRDDLETLRQRKRERNGGFDKGIYLVSVEDR